MAAADCGQGGGRGRLLRVTMPGSLAAAAEIFRPRLGRVPGSLVGRGAVAGGAAMMIVPTLGAPVQTKSRLEDNRNVIQRREASFKVHESLFRTHK